MNKGDTTKNLRKQGKEIAVGAEVMKGNFATKS